MCISGHLRAATSLILLGAGFLMDTVAIGQPGGARPTPEAALEVLKKGLETGDWKTVAAVLAHPKESRGFVPPELVEAWLRAQAASLQLETALRELAEKSGASNPESLAQHPWSAYLAPPGDFSLQVLQVEAAGQASKVRARIKCQRRGRGEEETVAVVRIGQHWYVTPPALLRQIFAGAEENTTATRRTQGLNQLADLLAETAKRVRSGELKDRQAVVEHLLRGFHRDQLAELLR